MFVYLIISFSLGQYLLALRTVASGMMGMNDLVTPLQQHAYYIVVTAVGSQHERGDIWWELRTVRTSLKFQVRLRCSHYVQYLTEYVDLIVTYGL